MLLPVDAEATEANRSKAKEGGVVNGVKRLLAKQELKIEEKVHRLDDKVDHLEASMQAILASLDKLHATQA